MEVRYRVRGIKELEAFLKTLPRGTVRAALTAFTQYVIGDSRHGLKHPDPYKYVSRKRAYGQTFKNDKQRRWFYANGGPDMIGNHRTGRSTDAWQYVEVSPYKYTITNPEPGAYFTRDDDGQARQPGMVGWRKVTRVIQDNMAGALRSATAAVNAWLKANKS